jgi:hypothetical protein
MARGAQKTAENNANTGFVNSTAANNQLTAQNNAIQTGLLIPGYENMIQNPGYDAATKAGVVSASQGATGAAFGSAADALGRRAARTGNSAGVIEGQDQLARDKATTMSTQAAENQLKFADAARSDQRAGLQGISSLYGVDQNLLARSIGIPPEYLGQYINAAQMKKGGFTGAFSTAFGSALGSGLGGGIAGGIGTGASQVGSGNYGW